MHKLNAIVGQMKDEMEKLRSELQDARTKSLLLRRECTEAKQQAAESSLSEASTSF